MWTYKNKQIDDGYFWFRESRTETNHSHILAMIAELKKDEGVNWKSGLTIDELLWEDSETLEDFGEYLLKLAQLKREEKIQIETREWMESF